MSPTALFNVNNGVTGYTTLLRYVLDNGELRSPRGKLTIDAGYVTVVMHDTSQPLPLGVGRNLNRSIAALEALQLVGRFSAPELMVAASRNFEQFLEPQTMRFYGAYGIRIGNQLVHVVNKFKSDPDTRQAGITLWNPKLDNVPGHRDYPCTVMLWFAVVGDTLELNVIMRSQDVWWGTPYDWMQFSTLQRSVANALSVTPGIYRHTTLSTHIYEQFTTDAKRVINGDYISKNSSSYQPTTGIGRAGDDIGLIISRAYDIAYGYPIDEPTKSERWFQDVIASLVV